MSMKDVYDEIVNLIDESDNALTKKTTGTEIRDSIAVALVSIARHHYSTIFNSIQTHNQINSAFALLRPLVEATYRALWIMLVATENQVRRIGDGTRQFSSSPLALAEKIDRKEGGTIFQSRYRGNSKLLNGMTHGGIELIGRQMKDGYIEPNFEELELVGLLSEATANYGMLLFYYGQFIKDDDLRITGGEIVKDIDLIKILST